MKIITKKFRAILWLGALFVGMAVVLNFLAPPAVFAGGREMSGGGMSAGRELSVGGDSLPGFSVSTVSMEADYGYDSTAKGSRYVPVRVELTNQDDRVFGGTLQILSMETDNTVYRYDYGVELEAGENKKDTYYIPLGTRADQLYVLLTDEEGNEVIRQRLKLNVNLESAELLIGVLSDTPEMVSYMDGVGISYSMLLTKTVSLSPEMIPDDKRGLDLLDVILITNFDLKTLSSDQIDAIMAWVKNGGTLLLGTGEGVQKILGPLSERLVDEPYGKPVKTAVDMGVEYATDGPGDSYIEAYCSTISLRNGNVLLSSDELPVLTMVEEEKGKIAVAAYDFCEIAPFCQVQRSYVEKIFLNLLGEERVSILASDVYNGQSSQYWSIQNVINTGDVNKLPNIALYVFVVLLYLILVSPALYLFLRRKDLQRHFRMTAALVAILFTGMIYLMGNKTRFHDTFFNFASIEDTTDSAITTTAVLNMRTPYNKPYKISLSPEYSVRPITRNYYDFTSASKFTGAESATVTLDHREESTALSVKGAVAFDPKYFILEKEEANSEKVGLTGTVTLFDGTVSGTVTNHYSTVTENVAVLFYGQLVPVGNLQPGETRNLNGAEVVNFPLNNSYMAAGLISGSDAYKKADINDKDYVTALEKSNLLMYYMDNYLSSSVSTARVVGFRTGKENTGFLPDDGYQTYGRSLLTAALDLNNRRGEETSRPALARQSKNNPGGGYSAQTNTMYGVDPLTLEYSLGSDLDLEKVTFNRISDIFGRNEKYAYYQNFTGVMSFYNYNTGNFDKMNAGKDTFRSPELEPYLSPSNTLTVKYVPEITEDFNWNILLPMVTIVGREK